MKYAFISYSSKDFNIAKELYKYFKEHNIGVWMAPFDIESGTSYGEIIPSALKNSSATILLLTKNTLESKWCKKEISRAIDFDKPIFPLALEPIDLNDEFGFYLTNCQIKIISDTKEGEHEFKEFLDRLMLYIPFESETITKIIISKEDFIFLKNLSIDTNAGDLISISRIQAKYRIGFRRASQYFEMLINLQFIEKLANNKYCIHKRLSELRQISYEQFVSFYL